MKICEKFRNVHCSSKNQCKPGFFKIFMNYERIFELKANFNKEKLGEVDGLLAILNNSQ